MAVDIALDGEKGLARAFVHDYDVIVLDRDLPVVHGDDVCARLVAARGRRRVLMLTGAAENEDLVEGSGSVPTTIWRSRSPSLCCSRGRRAGAPRATEHPAGAAARRHRARHRQAVRHRRTEGCVEDPGLRKLSGAGVPAGLGSAAGGAVVVPF